MNTTAQQKNRLLIVEDDSSIAHLVCKAAEELGFETCVVKGLEFTAAYRDFKPDLIVLDLLMPEMDGFEVIKFLNACESKAKIILLSGTRDYYRQMAGHLGNAFRLNIIANIAKPFRLAELRHALQASMPAQDVA